MKAKVLILALAAVMAGTALSGCKKKEGSGDPSLAGKKGILTIYSGRKEKYIKSTVDAFEKKTGVKVNLLVGDGSQLANQIVEEKNNPRADLYASSDAGTLGFLTGEKMLVPYQSEATDRVAANLKDNDHMWVGAAVRARVIMYNTELVKRSEAPKTLMELTNRKWKGQVGSVNSTNESMVGNISALRLAAGDKYAERFLKRLKANDPLLNKSHDPLRDAVAEGEIKVALVNHYYFAKKKAEGKPVDAIYPDQDGFGTFINIAGLAIVKGTKNEGLAQQFIDFCLSDEGQKIYPGSNMEIPVVESIEPEGASKKLSEFKVSKVKLGDLGKELDETLELMEKVGI